MMSIIQVQEIPTLNENLIILLGPDTVGFISLKMRNQAQLVRTRKVKVHIFFYNLVHIIQRKMAVEAKRVYKQLLKYYSVIYLQFVIVQIQISK